MSLPLVVLPEASEEIRDRSIEIVAFAHARRRPGYWLPRVG